MADQTPTPIVSAAPAVPLTKEARKKRFDELRQRMGKSRLEVKGKAGIHYFWAHKTDDAELIRLEGQYDYTIVREPNATEVLAGKAKPQIQASGLKADGTYQVGDVILVQCPQENYEFHLLKMDQDMEESKEAAKTNFMAEAEKQGVPTFEVDKPKR